MCEVRCRKKRRRDVQPDALVRCWPMFVGWLEVGSVVRLASTCTEYARYAREVTRAWPFELAISAHHVEHEPEMLVCLLSKLSPGERRITLSYHGMHRRRQSEQ